MIKQTPPYTIKFLLQKRTHQDIEKRLQYFTARCIICLKIPFIKTGRRREKIIAYKRKIFWTKQYNQLQSFQDNTLHMCQKVICHE